MDSSTKRLIAWSKTGMGLAVAALVLLLFLPAVRYGFVGFDDTRQVLGNPLVRDLSFSGLYRMFTRFSVTSYYPIRLLSFALDYRVWKESAAGYHLTNILIHVANVLLLYGLAVRLQTAARAPAPHHYAAAFCALLFGIHPVVVEPVAWIAGREELLTTLFGLCCIHCHAIAERTDNPTHAGRWRLLSVLALVPACLSNVLAVVTPLICLLWRLLIVEPTPANRARGLLRAAARLWPLWLVAGITLLLKIHSVAVMMDYRDFTEEMQLGFVARLSTILNVYRVNMLRVFRPARLAPIHTNVVPHTLLDPRVAAGAALVVATAALLWATRRKPAILLGLAWFLVGLAPSSQILAHHIFHADRFLYFPLAGMALAVAFGTGQFARLSPTALHVGCALLVALLLGISRQQRRIWRDTDTLFQHVLRISPDSFLAYYSYGRALADGGRFEEALACYRKGLDRKPNHANALYQAGSILIRLGQNGEAATHLERALELKPDFGAAAVELGRLAAEQGNMARAIAHFSIALGLQPGHPALHDYLGRAHDQAGDTQAALSHFSAALERQPDNPNVHNRMGVALARSGRLGPALHHFSRAIAIQPTLAGAHINAGLAMQATGRGPEAIRHFSEAVRLEPQNPKARTLSAHAQR